MKSKKRVRQTNRQRLGPENKLMDEQQIILKGCKIMNNNSENIEKKYRIKKELLVCSETNAPVWQGVLYATCLLLFALFQTALLSQGFNSNYLSTQFHVT